MFGFAWRDTLRQAVVRVQLRFAVRLAEPLEQAEYLCTGLPPEDQDLCYSLAGRAGSDVIRDGDGNDRRRNAAHVECDRAVVPLKGITLAGLYAAEYLFKVNRPARSAGLKQRRTGLRDLNRLNEFGDHSQGHFLRIAVGGAPKQLRNGCIDEG